MSYGENGVYRPGMVSFEPAKKLVRTKGASAANYLEVKWRLVMLRDMYPEAKVTTSMLYHDPVKGFAVMKAHVELPPTRIDPKTGAIITHGGEGDGTKSESMQDFRDYIEKAETGAIGRALYNAGVGAQFSDVDFEYEAVSPKDYTGVDAGIVPDPKEAKPVPEKLPTLEKMRELIRPLVDKLGADAVKAETMRRFGVNSSAELKAAQFYEILTWAQTQAAK